MRCPATTRGDGRADMIYQFQLETVPPDKGTFLYNTGPIRSLASANWNSRQFCSVTKVTGGRQYSARNLSRSTYRTTERSRNPGRHDGHSCATSTCIRRIPAFRGQGSSTERPLAPAAATASALGRGTTTNP